MITACAEEQWIDGAPPACCALTRGTVFIKDGLWVFGRRGNTRCCSALAGRAAGHRGNVDQTQQPASPACLSNSRALRPSLGPHWALPGPLNAARLGQGGRSNVSPRPTLVSLHWGEPRAPTPPKPRQLAHPCGWGCRQPGAGRGGGAAVGSGRGGGPAERLGGLCASARRAAAAAGPVARRTCWCV